MKRFMRFAEGCMSLIVKTQFKTSVKRLEIIPGLKEKNAKLNNNKKY